MVMEQGQHPTLLEAGVSSIANIVTYLKLKVTNAVVEGLNNKIERVKRLACGFCNRANYRMAIMFHCGGLDLEPRGIHFP